VTDEATWYKDAILYEVRARSFFDSNGDGIGDFLGLASKLDYLEDLGVTALWVLPFYPSPGRDDGYDIADYMAIHRDLGTMADFELLLAEAHRRGLRVITELVLNHTSDQHAWFQRARRAPPGSPERDFYVWRETPDAYKDARIIFKDFETSNWTWDAEAGAYFWHRFYSHQPDLNFANPKVQEALLEVVDFWLAKGVDGLRLDAVPYLYEEDGTNCENLPATHAFLKKLRAHIDGRFENRMLLAEANQWPEDAAAYFGQGDECHMNFHFPLMPRMFMALHMEDRLPITDIFAQTPAVHPTCQWALFLRNHDELTLEMVTDEERDYMYRAYARQAAMRINLGIRRRFAPLVGNSRRKMELLNGLLFSLPGTPVVYYGDEIGMGDNVYLGDRNGVRTPMQWSMDRNAGFSKANPQGLILPLVIDPEYHYESLNVENQQQNPSSLLWWTKRLIALRKRFGAFGRGSIEFLTPSNSRVLSYVRQWDNPGAVGVSSRTERVLVVANLSRFVQYVELDLSKYEGVTPVELFGKTRFPVVKKDPYVLTLGPHGFYWFSLEPPEAPPSRASLPRLPASSFEWTNIEGHLCDAELGSALGSFLEGRPWFREHDRAATSARIVYAERLGAGPVSVFMTLARVEFPDGDVETYALPLVVAAADAPGGAVLAEVTLRAPGRAEEQVALVDALEDPVSARAFLRAFAGAERGATALVVWAPEGLTPTENDLRPDPRKIGSEAFDTTIAYGEGMVLQMLRRIEPGASPEVVLGRLLRERNADVAPRLLASLQIELPRAEPSTLAIVHAFVPGAETGWIYTLRELGRYYDDALALPKTEAPPLPAGHLLDLAVREPPPIMTKLIGGYLDAVGKLGRKVADLHTLLASGEGPAFEPEPYTAHDGRSKYQSLRNLSGAVLRSLKSRQPELPARAQREAEEVLAREADILKRFEPLLKLKTNAARIRVHGDLHLGHVLHTGKDFVVTAIGENRSQELSARVRKRSPLRDLAAMVRSFDFAAIKLLLDPARVRESDFDAARPWEEAWAAWVSAAFLRAYFAATPGATFLPREPAQVAALFDAFVLERALHQLERELDARPDVAGVTVSLVGILHVLSTTARAP
jgi:maltose alpha-D-glucosyltransferase/alpha-amylase